jgi:diketogulonate reductase-like aldo/keto reductase
LGLASVDLFLIHSPKGGKCIATWREMLAARDLGLTRAVGVCNFGVKQLESLAKVVPEQPAVNQFGKNLRI